MAMRELIQRLEEGKGVSARSIARKYGKTLDMSDIAADVASEFSPEDYEDDSRGILRDAEAMFQEAAGRNIDAALKKEGVSGSDAKKLKKEVLKLIAKTIKRGVDQVDHILSRGG
jgi:hypothetical protein